LALIDGAKAAFPVHRLCRVLGVSQSGYFAWRSRPAWRRQRDDMVLLAHVRSAFALSNATYRMDFTPTVLDKKWGADISYVWTREGWRYLAVVIDLFARRIVGWATGDRLHRDLALAALRKALTMRRPAAGLIHHSDRGSQYCSIDYQAELKKHAILVSMSGKGNCYDNARVEAFFKTLKSELV
jgi:transposase InsO family protein